MNERITEIPAIGTVETAIVILCECGRGDCLTQLEVPSPTYERTREHGARFLVAPDHLRGEVEEIVEQQPGYLIVAKKGVAGALARKADPND